MKKSIFLLIFLTISLMAVNKEKETYTNDVFSPFLIVQEDLSNQQIILTPKELSQVKSDGSYCYVDKITKWYLKIMGIDINHKSFPEKYCKDKPPLKNLTKIIQTIDNKYSFYSLKEYDEVTNIAKRVFISDEEEYRNKTLSSDSYSYYYDNYTITHESIDSKHILKMGKNKVKLNVSGLPVISRGECSSQTSVIITMKINDDLVFENLYTNNYCRNLKYLENIILDFKKNILTLNLNDNYFIEVPFSYFKKKGNQISFLTSDDLVKFVDFPNNMFAKSPK